MPSAVLRTLHASEPGDVIVFTHGDVVTDVWYRDHRQNRPPFINALPIDAVALAGDFRGWPGSSAAEAFIAAATDGTVNVVEDTDGELLVGIRCYGEWWESVPARTHSPSRASRGVPMTCSPRPTRSPSTGSICER